MMKTIIVEASEDSLDEITEFINEQLETLDADPKTMFEIELCIEEIVVNISSYAYENVEDPDHPKTIEVGCELQTDPRRVTIQFKDTGKPFDPLSTKEADVSGKMFMEQDGGFGIHIVKETMDEVSYAFEDGANVLTVRKSL